MLPDRSAEAEDAFVAQLADAEDPGALAAAITEAMQARRPRLAARLVVCLSDLVEVEPGSPIDRARRAAELTLATRSPEPAPEETDLDEAWTLARSLRFRRSVRRHRHGLGAYDRDDRSGPFGTRRRR